MDDSKFDRALVAAAFSLAGERGWPQVSVAAAARAADLPLDQARARFFGRNAILARFGRLADESALAQAQQEGSNRDRLFDLLMRRIDFLQLHRGGVLALKTYLPRDPGLALMLYGATAASMAWLLEAAGIPTGGARGALRVHGLTAIWARTLRAWERDESEDLPATMAALDKGLDRAVRAESWLPFGKSADEPIPDFPPADDPIDTEGVMTPVAPSSGFTPPPPPPIEPESSPSI